MIGSGVGACVLEDLCPGVARCWQERAERQNRCTPTETSVQIRHTAVTACRPAPLTKRRLLIQLGPGSSTEALYAPYSSSKRRASSTCPVVCSVHVHPRRHLR